MSTTAIFVELLVSGIEALIWIALLVAPSLPCVDKEMLKSFATLITGAAVAVAYALGIIVDKIADWFFESLARRFDKPLATADFDEMRLRVMAKNERIAGFLDYQRSRMRVARSTLLNLMFLTFAGARFVQSQWRGAVIASGIVAFIATAFTWYKIRKKYDEQLWSAYKMLR